MTFMLGHGMIGPVTVHVQDENCHRFTEFPRDTKALKSMLASVVWQYLFIKNRCKAYYNLAVFNRCIMLQNFNKSYCLKTEHKHLILHYGNLSGLVSIMFRKIACIFFFFNSHW